SYSTMAQIDANQTSYTFENLELGQDLDFYLVAESANAPTSAESEHVGFATPAGPNAFSARGISGNIQLGWEDTSAEQDGYVLERSSDNVDFQPLTTLDASARSYLDPGAEGEQWYYRLRAVGSPYATPPVSARIPLN